MPHPHWLSELYTSLLNTRLPYEEPTGAWGVRSTACIMEVIFGWSPIQSDVVIRQFLAV